MPEAPQQASSKVKTDTTVRPTEVPRPPEYSDPVFEGIDTYYSISFAADHTLRWHPHPNSRELAHALSYHFPLEAGLEAKMRAATTRFLQAEKRARMQLVASTFLSGSTTETSHEPFPKGGPSTPTNAKSAIIPADLHVSQPSDRLQCILDRSTSRPPAKRPVHVTSASFKHTSKLLTFDSAMNETSQKRTKRAYKVAEAAEVAANRGKVCPEHKRRKVKVRPKIVTTYVLN